MTDLAGVVAVTTGPRHLMVLTLAGVDNNSRLGRVLMNSLHCPHPCECLKKGSSAFLNFTYLLISKKCHHASLELCFVIKIRLTFNSK